jgi:hypothetical protein
VQRTVAAGELGSLPDPRRDDEAVARFRYGAVFALALTIVIFLIASPSGPWARAIALGLEFGALLVVIETSRVRQSLRRARATAVTILAALTMLLTGIGVLPSAATFALGGLLSLIVPAALVNGLLRLLRTRGVTMQTVAGALAIYLLIGIVFASLIGLIAEISSAPYFANGSDGSLSERVYYSFTVLTTTGFGDFTAALSVGRAVAVVEMLLGQLYLVTVIGVLVGHIAASREPG